MPGRAVSGRAGGVDGDPPIRARSASSTAGEGVSSMVPMASLDRAVALAEVNHVPVRVGQHLNLDVARVLDVAILL